MCTLAVMGPGVSGAGSIPKARRNTEFDEALAPLAAGIDVDPIITLTFDLSDARRVRARGRSLDSVRSAAPHQP